MVQESKVIYIRYSRCYNNSKNSEYLAKARTNALQLEEHLGRGRRGFDNTCRMCRKEENLENFMVEITQTGREKR